MDKVVLLCVCLCGKAIVGKKKNEESVMLVPI